MAYDRFDTRQGSRERWRSDERYDRDRDLGDRDFGDRERSYRDRDERGFFERAGDEIASWFGDDEAERRRRRDERAHGRDSDYGRREYGRDSRWDRDDESRRGWREDDDDRGFLSSASYRGYSGEGRESRPMWSTGSSGDRDRSYRPMTGDYGRSEFGSRRDRSGSDDQRRSRFGGRDRGHDPHYAEWRNRQMDELDRDYDEYRRENQSRFEDDFGNWRNRRQGQRQMLGNVREHMEVVGSDDEHVGKVDRVSGDRIILTKSDENAGGVHHSIPCSLVDKVEDQRVILNCDADKAKQRWRDENRDRALFEREDSGQSGPMMLDRSFSGTYR